MEMNDDWSPKLNCKYSSETFKEKFITKGWRAPAEIPQKKAKIQVIPAGLDYLIVALVISIVFTVQTILAVGSYSGEGVKPLHGDFEAQRHWLEITYNLPITQWYVNGPDNDLLYWGLDYPPLTAYHSWLMGFVASRLNSSWIELKISRGIETPASKMFMRATAIIPYFLLYLPAVLALCRIAKCDKVTKNTLFTCCFTYAGLIVIDFAHFQYNSVSLGLFLSSYVALVSDYTLIGSIFYCLAVNYKQMELYHALPIFVFILGRCLKRPLLSRIPETIKALLPVALVVLATFAVIWFPFIAAGHESILAVLSRVFPFHRGLYEDKVASLWCALSPVLKLNRLFEHGALLRLCTGSVILSSLPSLLILFLRPTAKNFRFSLFLTSLSFFLLSFQVHEKSILLAAITALILLPEYPAEMAWFLHIANTSLFSLCIKDKTEMCLFLFIAYYVLCSIALPKFNSMVLNRVKDVSFLVSIGLCLAEWFLPPPARLPHIFPLLSASFSCWHFVGSLLFFNYKMLSEEWQKWSKKTA